MDKSALAAMRVSFLIKNLIRLLCMVISFFFDLAHETERKWVRENAIKAIFFHSCYGPLVGQ